MNVTNGHGISEMFVMKISLKTCTHMNNFFRTIIAGYGAKKLGGGCLGTIIVFIIIYMLLRYV